MLIERIRGYFIDAGPETEGKNGEERRRARRKEVFLRATLYPIDVFADALGDLDQGSHAHHHLRSIRTKVNGTARLVGGRPPRTAIVRNLSSCGMLLDTGPGLSTGQHMVVRVGNFPPIYGRAQWSNDGLIGFRAHNPIAVSAVASRAE